MGSLPNRIKQELTKIASQVPSVKFVSSALGNQSGIEWAESDIKNLLSVVVTKALAGHCQLGTGDLLLLTYGPKEDSVSIHYIYAKESLSFIKHNFSNCYWVEYVSQSKIV